MVTMIKGDLVKFVDENGSSFERLKADGWKQDGVQEETDEAKAEEVNERDALMEKAKAMGLNPHHKAGVEKLKEMLSAKE